MNKLILEKAIEHYGEEHQIIKAIEELSELTTELARRANEQGLRIHLLNEIADASIMIEQLKMIFGEGLVDKLVTDKLNRLNDRIHEDEIAVLSGAV